MENQKRVMQKDIQKELFQNEKEQTIFWLFSKPNFT